MNAVAVRELPQSAERADTLEALRTRLDVMQAGWRIVQALLRHEAEGDDTTEERAQVLFGQIEVLDKAQADIAKCLAGEFAPIEKPVQESPEW